MSFFLMKSILASIFLLAGILAVLSMFILMGKPDLKISAAFLRRFHRITGLIFFILLIIISYICIKYWITVGDNTSTRAMLHSVLALGLFSILFLKILIVQFYKQLIRFAPPMGMIVFCLAFVVFCTSAGYYFLRTTVAEPEPADMITSIQPASSGDVEEGAMLFRDKCSSCHFADKEQKSIGPSLKGLLKMEKLPSSRRPATIENVKKQLIRPFLAMPSFTNLSGQEMADLLAYLETL